MKNREALTEALTSAFAPQDGQEIALRLIRAGVPAGPVLPVDEATAAPHTAHRNMVAEIGWYRGLNTPIKLSRTPGGARAAPPRFGEHGHAILSRHGYATKDIAALAKNGVLWTKRRN